MSPKLSVKSSRTYGIYRTVYEAIHYENALITLIETYFIF